MFSKNKNNTSTLTSDNNKNYKKKNHSIKNNNNNNINNNTTNSNNPLDLLINRVLSEHIQFKPARFPDKVTIKPSSYITFSSTNTKDKNSKLPSSSNIYRNTDTATNNNTDKKEMKKSRPNSIAEAVALYTNKNKIKDKSKTKDDKDIKDKQNDSKLNQSDKEKISNPVILVDSNNDDSDSDDDGEEYDPDHSEQHSNADEADESADDSGADDDEDAEDENEEENYHTADEATDASASTSAEPTSSAEPMTTGDLQNNMDIDEDEDEEEGNELNPIQELKKRLNDDLSPFGSADEADNDSINKLMNIPNNTSTPTTATVTAPPSSGSQLIDEMDQDEDEDEDYDENVKDNDEEDEEDSSESDSDSEEDESSDSDKQSETVPRVSNQEPKNLNKDDDDSADDSDVEESEDSDSISDTTSSDSNSENNNENANDGEDDTKEIKNTKITNKITNSPIKSSMTSIKKENTPPTSPDDLEDSIKTIDHIPSYYDESEFYKLNELKTDRGSNGSNRINKAWDEFTSHRHPLGLLNHGVTCYMNSAVQALIHIPALLHYLIDVHNNKVDNISANSVTKVLADTTAKLYQIHANPGKKVVYINPKRLIKRLEDINCMMSEWQQEDSHEYLMSLVSRLQEDSTPKGVKLNESIIYDIFGGLLNQSVTCKNCGHISTTQQEFYDLSLSLDKKGKKNCSILDLQQLISLKNQLLNLNSTNESQKKEILVLSEILNQRILLKSKEISQQKNLISSTSSPSPSTTSTSPASSKSPSTSSSSPSPSNSLPNSPSKSHPTDLSKSNNKNNENQNSNTTSQLNDKNLTATNTTGSSKVNKQEESHQQSKAKYSIENSISDFFSPELIRADKKDKSGYSCENCKKTTNAIKISTIDRAPETLTVHLKRFRFNGSLSMKVKTNVAYPDTLDLTEFTTDMKTPVKYKLSSVIVHQGRSVSSGHYIAICREADGTWSIYDDEYVNKMHPREALSDESAYVLIYNRLTHKSVSNLGSSKETATENGESTKNGINNNNNNKKRQRSDSNNKDQQQQKNTNRNKKNKNKKLKSNKNHN
ncbi:hypothetical protein BVG19_g23 [[Candida] boidinii]|nr:hypothetical protein BVG19_g23 [[Candida] boidinii]OWB52277.1 hypothetical protein B5S27_g3850 [[Candida] boidinii]